ncbi:MAG: endonuclease III domain-containing protein [Verrucomicrobiia bacterium]|jgi:endonuclease-3 related protein
MKSEVRNAKALRNSSLPLRRAFHLLFCHFGPQRWWPGDTPFEVCVGAILTQNTAWTNVEKAIANLRRADVLLPPKMRTLPHAELAALIRPAGYFNVKARRLRSFLDFLHEQFRDNLRTMFRLPTAALREKLLAVNGIGPETADSILLYAGGHESFVVDAYTKRIIVRHGWAQRDPDYHELKTLFEQSLLAPPSFRSLQSAIPFSTGHEPSDMSVISKRHSSRARLFNEYHALIVAVGKHYCLAREPRCEACPLRPLLPRAGARKS